MIKHGLAIAIVMTVVGIAARRWSRGSASQKKTLSGLVIPPVPMKAQKAYSGIFARPAGHIGFEADHYPGGMHLYAASLENPEEFKPTFHVNKQSKLPWLQLTDDLEAFEGTLLHTPNDPDGYQ